MEDWSEELFKLVNAIGNELDQALIDLSRDVDQAIVDFFDFSTQVSETFKKTFNLESDPFLEGIDQCLDGVAETLTTLLMAFEVPDEESSDFPMEGGETVLRENPACEGCRHYHGQVYGGNLLVCAIHPYGWQEESCPDWESTWSD